MITRDDIKSLERQTRPQRIREKLWLIEQLAHLQIQEICKKMPIKDIINTEQIRCIIQTGASKAFDLAEKIDKIES